MQLLPVINYSLFYRKSLPQDPFHSIKSYPTDAILSVLSKLNAGLYLINLETLNGKVELLTKIFPHLSYDRKNRIDKLYFRPDSADFSEYGILFTRQAISWLMAHSFSFFKTIDNSQLITEQEIQNNIFDAILVANELYYNEQTKYPVGSYEHIWEIMLRQQNYVGNHFALIQSGTAKMMFFNDFINKTVPEADKLFEEFSDKLGLKNYWGYCFFFLDIISNISADYKKDGNIRWSIAVTEENKKIIETFSHKSSDYTGTAKLESLHGDIIPKPIYFALDEFALLLDINFFAWIIDTALPYNFYSFTSISEKLGKRKFGEFKAHLGKSFYEDFLGKKLFGKIFSKSTCYFDTDINGFSDLLIIEGSSIFIIEFKSVALHYKTLDQLNVLEFKSFIEENFLSNKKGNQSRNKGVYQILNCIDKLTEELDTKLDLGIKNKNRKYALYPVIIFIDPILENYGVNAYCNDQFQFEVKKFNPQFKHIYPLTLININFFLLQYNKISQKNTLLKQYIKEYHSKNGKLKKSYTKSGDPMEFLKSSISFDKFVQSFLDIDINSLHKVSEDFNLPK